MKCSDTGALLDLLMDGALREDQLEALEAHARECPECAAQLRATRALSALMEELPPEVDVPLTAQAVWRGAVRDESKARRVRRLTRWVSAVAAGAVLLVGVGATFLRQPARYIGMRDAVKTADAVNMDAGAPEEAYEAVADESAAFGAAMAGGAVESMVAAEDAAVLEADGMSLSMAEPAETAAAPMQEVRVKVDDVDAACDAIRDLVSEYEGSAELQRTDSGANLYVTLPGENLGDFMSAIARWEIEGEPVPGGAETASLLLVVHP